MREKISRQGDTIIVGDMEFPIEQIRYVEVVFRPPRRFLFFAVAGLALFLLTAILLVAVAMLSILGGNSNSPVINWAVGLIFFSGGALSIGALIFAMIAYPIEWRVEVATTQGTYLVKVEKSRTRATIFLC
jgi:hypothetical protein